jgi:hypothetical protein
MKAAKATITFCPPVYCCPIHHFLIQVATMSDDDLSINAKNRHQYFKTVMRSASADEKNIQAAEARGRERLAREQEMKRKATMVFRISLVLAVIGAAGYFAYRYFA